MRHTYTYTNAHRERDDTRETQRLEPTSLNSSNDFSLFLQALLFNPAKPFSRGTGNQSADVDLMIDCFVSCFRINPHNNQHFKVCPSLCRFNRLEVLLCFPCKNYSDL